MRTRPALLALALLAACIQATSAAPPKIEITNLTRVGEFVRVVMASDYSGWVTCAAWDRKKKAIAVQDARLDAPVDKMVIRVGDRMADVKSVSCWWKR